MPELKLTKKFEVHYEVMQENHCYDDEFGTVKRVSQTAIDINVWVEVPRRGFPSVPAGLALQPYEWREITDCLDDETLLHLTAKAQLHLEQNPVEV